MNFIETIDGAVSDDLCEMFVLYMRLARDRQLETRCNLDYRSCHLLPLPHFGLPEEREAVNAFYAEIRPHVTAYRERMKFLETAVRIEKTNVLLYEPDGKDKFHPHMDAWDLGTATRQVSIVLYCNTVDEGGETVFVRQDERIRPEKGRLVLFPSGWTHPHEAKAPMSGPKIAVVSWLHLSVPGLKFWTEPF